MFGGVGEAFKEISVDVCWGLEDMAGTTTRVVKETVEGVAGESESVTALAGSKNTSDLYALPHEKYRYVVADATSKSSTQ